MEGGAQNKQEPIAKILNKADYVSRLFFHRKKNKKAEWMPLGKDNGCVLHLLMFYNSKGGEDCATKLMVTESLQPSVQYFLKLRNKKISGERATM